MSYSEHHSSNQRLCSNMDNNSSKNRIGSVFYPKTRCYINNIASMTDVLRSIYLVWPRRGYYRRQECTLIWWETERKQRRITERENNTCLDQIDNTKVWWSKYSWWYVIINVIFIVNSAIRNIHYTNHKWPDIGINEEFINGINIHSVEERNKW